MMNPAVPSSPSSSAPLFTCLDPSLLAVATAAERVDNANWFDDFASAPPHVQQALDLRYGWNSLQQPPEFPLVMVSSHIPFFHFNVASTLGIDSDVVPEPVLDSIQTFFGPGKTHHITVAERFLDTESASAAQECEVTQNKIHELLVRRGYAKYLSFDRVILQDPFPDLVESWSDWGSSSELVTEDNKAEWSSFLTGYYKMPGLIGDWLQQLVGRPHWFHAVLKKDGKVVMARSLYAQNGWGWLGIDAPVPGWTPADCHDDDLAVCSKLLATAHKEAKITSFVSDVEAPNEAQTGPDYDKWTKLGFSVPYKRVVYKREEEAAAAAAETPANDKNSKD